MRIEAPGHTGFPWELPAVAALAGGVTLHPKVTYFYLDQLGDPRALRPYGGRSLHAQSHGESFLSILIHRFGPDGLSVLDEPEAALSTQNYLTCLRRIHELTSEGAQFLVATHSPIILAYPEATIYRCDDDGLAVIDDEDAEPVALTRGFLTARERLLSELLGE